MMSDEDTEPVGPFVTVVSVDGGLQCGNKLTVITPTEINDNGNGKKGNNSEKRNGNAKAAETGIVQPKPRSKQMVPVPCHKGKVSAIPTLVGVDRKPNNNAIIPPSDAINNVAGTAYVTVVSLADKEQDEMRGGEEGQTGLGGNKSGIPVKASHQGRNHINTKSIVQLGKSEFGEKEQPRNGIPVPLEDKQFITISNKVKGHKTGVIMGEKNGCRDEGNWQMDERSEIPKVVTEEVTVLRLPGERLGFGLKFEGGVTNPADKVRHLYIQSCAFDSPSIKAKTSWGNLGEGDEIIEIENIAINTMTRMDCIQKLKDSSVAVRLLITHTFTPDELSLLRAQREIALQQQKVRNEDQRGLGQDQNKAGGEIGKEIKIGSKSKSQIKEVINTNANDSSCKLYHAHSNAPNQQLTTGETILPTISSNSKIPVFKPRQIHGMQMQMVNPPSSTTNYNPNNLDNDNKAGSHEEQSGDGIVYDHNENEIEQDLAFRELDEEQVHQRLKPPTGFGDELLPHRHQSPISFDGNRMRTTGSMIPKTYYNNHHQQSPAEAQFYLNAISPTHYHRNSSVSLESYGMESDETGSSRSTVVSRLSMASSITSMTASMNLPSDTLPGNLVTQNGQNSNGHHVLLAKRKSSLSSPFLGDEVVGEGETNLKNGKLEDNNVPNTRGELEESGIGMGKIGDNNGKDASSSEIPLAPPLFFQDAQHEHGNSQRPTLPARITLEAKRSIPPRAGENLVKDANSGAYEGEFGCIIKSQAHNKTGQPVRRTSAVGNGVSDAKLPPPSTLELSAPRFASEGNKSRDENYKTSVQAVNGNGNVEELNPAFTDDSTNWEQKGILDDDDDLALLAEELGLGLDTEDEDLYNSLVAEIDEISAQVVGARHLVTNLNVSEGGRNENLDELIQNTFNGHSENELKGQEVRRSQEFSFYQQQWQRQQHQQFCATSSTPAYQIRDEIRDACVETFANTEEKQWKTKRKTGKEISENNDEIEGGPNNGDAFKNVKDLNNNSIHLFPSFSKVVEPINTQNRVMTIKNKLEEEGRHRHNQLVEEANFGNHVSQVNGSEEKMNIQAPAPPPRTKGLEKRNKGNQKEGTTTSSQNISGNNTVTIEERPASASATIVQIENRNRPDAVTRTKTKDFNSIKLEVRRHNSLTSVCEETSGINPPRAASDLRGDEDYGNGEGVLDDSTQRIDDSSHKDGKNLVLSSSAATTTQQGAPTSDGVGEITSPPERMDSSNEILHHRHRFPPPTFSRLPPDGDEFPNKCWSDENKVQQVTGKSFSPPPPLPTSEPPKEDFGEVPPLLPATVPPLPPKKVATRRCSFDDRKRSFDTGTSIIMGVQNPKDEPSKKSVRDKIAMFSSRSSSEDSADGPPPPPVFPKHASLTSSLPKSNVNGFSMSSENLLNSSGTGRKGSLDLTHAPPTPPKPTASLYGTMTRTSNGASSGTPLGTSRSQSMIDVGGISSYQRPSQTLANNNYSNGTGRPVSSLMEQRRKCMTKLRGLVIPDNQDSGASEKTNKNAASIADLPTIISKDAIIPPHTGILTFNATTQNVHRPMISRTESLDRFSSVETNSPIINRSYMNQTSAKPSNDLQGNESVQNYMPKYSPAFKRRGLSAYQSSLSSTLPAKNSTAINATYKFKAPEPKTIESLRSDSSFEPNPTEKPNNDVKIENKSHSKITNGKSGKMEDSDNDSAVSSSRSSISHGLSPPNSPTPGESTTATPDPDTGSEDKQGQDERSMNMDESWRILKPTSVEAINRKNVLKSAKFSSGGGEENGNNVNDDSSLSSSNGKNRRSDDEEASYADAETEDTESSCSELESGGTRRRVAGRQGRRDESKNDTTEEDDDEEPPQQSAVNMEFTELTESPLQAIYDMEVKMAYINEVCDALNDRGRSEVASRYFSRRDSEATVIERPIEPKRKMSTDTVDTAAERRARNRSSSGNESDFSSNVSITSQQNSHRSLSREPSNSGTGTERWSVLEKKYSRSMTSVNSLGMKPERSEPQTLTPATSVPKIVTSASEVVEKKIEKFIEKTITTDGSIPKKTNPNIPRGRNDFKSIAEKWQKIEKSTDPATGKPSIPEKPVLTPQTSSGIGSSTPSTPTRSQNSLASSPSPPATSPAISKTLANILDTKSSGDNSAASSVPSTPTRTLLPSARESTRAKLEAMEADRAWAEKRRSEGEPVTTRVTGPAGSAKRSVSVNDIRKAFEKAEIAVNAYNREEGSPTEVNGKKENGLTLPSAHFRVSSFDSTTSEDSSATTPGGIYGSSNSLVSSSAARDPYGSITSLASSTSLISPQELQQLIDEANQSLEEAGTPSHEVSVVILHREFAGGSLGITLAGGADYETKEITVHKVLTASLADRDGRVHRGDRILSINGKSTRGLTHKEALYLLKSPRTEVVLVVSRGRRSVSNGFQTIEETSALDRAVEPLLNGNLVIENDDDTCYKWGPLRIAVLVKDGAGLGFSLEGGKGSIQGDKPLTVKKIFIGGPAEKSGELKVGDLIVSINQIQMSSKSRTEAWNFMKKLSDGEVKIAIRSPLV